MVTISQWLRRISASYALTARVEKRSKEFLVERLKILEYLILHARQIDMVMGDHHSIRQYKEKILTEITTDMSVSVRFDLA